MRRDIVAVMYAFGPTGVHDRRLLAGYRRWRSGRGGFRGTSSDDDGEDEGRDKDHCTIVEFCVTRPRRILYGV